MSVCGLSDSQQKLPLDAAASLQRFIASLPAQRWFAGKAKTISGADFKDIIDLSTAAVVVGLGVIEVRFTDGTTDLYLSPLPVPSEPVGRNRLWLRLLQRVFLDPTPLNSQCHGRLIGHATTVLNLDCLRSYDDDSLRENSAQQSNTSVAVGSEYFLKLFRRPQPGINPDAELGNALTAQAFKNSPAVAGTIEYVDSAGVSRCIAILSQQVHATADAWSFCLDRLGAFWTQLKRNPATASAKMIPHVEWQCVATPSELPTLAHELLGKFVTDARRLGQRTGELHRALSADSDLSDIAPMPATNEAIQQLLRGIRHEIGVTDRLLKDRHNLVAQLGAADFASDFTGRAILLLDALTTSASPDFDFIRVHGDYHLGQVLRTEESSGASDFQIIDFEGEPDRPIAERREKRPAMKDVAGMIRSFHYASNAGAVGLIDALDGLPSDLDVAAWQQFWFACTTHSFLETYRQTVHGLRLIPAEPANAQRLLDVFLLEKAMYELRYELNNRPDWARIPLIGLASTLGLSLSPQQCL